MFRSTTPERCAQLKTPMRTLDEGLSLILKTVRDSDLMSAPKIKFDLQIKYGSEYGPEEERAVLEVLRQGAPTSGEACIQFEKDFAAYCGTAHARAVSNGTAALFLSLVALGDQTRRPHPDDADDVDCHRRRRGHAGGGGGLRGH